MMKINREDLDIQLNGEVEIFLLEGKEYNGTVFEEFKNSIVAIFEVKNGMKNGKNEIYFPNKFIERSSNYKDGVLDGITKNYYDSGEMQEESFFEKGICLWYKLYNKNGELTEEFNIRKDSFEYNLLEIYRKFDDYGNAPTN